MGEGERGVNLPPELQQVPSRVLEVLFGQVAEAGTYSTKPRMLRGLHDAGLRSCQARAVCECLCSADKPHLG